MSALGMSARQAGSGHHLPLAVAFEFLTLSESKWPLYGAEVGGGFGSTCHWRTIATFELKGRCF